MRIDVRKLTFYCSYPCAALSLLSHTDDFQGVRTFPIKLYVRKGNELGIKLFVFDSTEKLQNEKEL